MLGQQELAALRFVHSYFQTDIWNRATTSFRLGSVCSEHKCKWTLLWFKTCIDVTPASERTALQPPYSRLRRVFAQAPLKRMAAAQQLVISMGCPWQDECSEMIFV